MTMSRTGRLLTQSVLVVALAVGGAVALGSPASAAEPAPTQSVAKFEVDFMEDTIKHHNLAIEMGELCVAKSTDAQLTDLCQNVITTQTREREQLQAWLVDWYGVTPPSDTALPPNGDETLAKLAGYDGEEFNAEMAETFIRHHFTFLPDADKCRDTAYHGQLASLCTTMYQAQDAQIPQFREVVERNDGPPNYGPKGQPGGSSPRGGSAQPADHSTYNH